MDTQKVSEELTSVAEANKALNEIVKKHGIKILQDYIIRHNKKTGVKHNRVSIAKMVYELMSGEDKLNRKSAIAITAKATGLTVSSVSEHLRKFDKESYEIDYISFSKGINNDYFNNNEYYSLDEIIEHSADNKNIAIDKAKAFYFKYQADKHNENLKVKEIRRVANKREQEKRKRRLITIENTKKMEEEDPFIFENEVPF